MSYNFYVDFFFYEKVIFYWNDKIYHGLKVSVSHVAHIQLKTDILMCLMNIPEAELVFGWTQNFYIDGP